MQTPNDMQREVDNYRYRGNRGEWGIAYTIPRDSGLEQQANWQAFEDILAELDCWAIERNHHWAIGWVDWILVRPGSPCWEIALELRARMRDYPILDDDLYSELEYDYALDIINVALRDHGYPDGFEAAPFVYKLACEDDGEGSPYYYGVEEWWPTRRQCFFGYLHYRRATSERSSKCNT